MRALPGSPRTGYLSSASILNYLWNSDPVSCAVALMTIGYVLHYDLCGVLAAFTRIASHSYALWHLTAAASSNTDTLVAPKLVLHLCNLKFFATLNIRCPNSPKCQTSRLRVLRSMSSTKTAFHLSRIGTCISSPFSQRKVAGVRTLESYTSALGCIRRLLLLQLW
jgi:hypothetical protein